MQVTQELCSLKTEKREYDRLLEIRDIYPKYVLTTDEFSRGNYEGFCSLQSRWCVGAYFAMNIDIYREFLRSSYINNFQKLLLFASDGKIIEYVKLIWT